MAGRKCRTGKRFAMRAGVEVGLTGKNVPDRNMSGK